MSRVLQLGLALTLIIGGGERAAAQVLAHPDPLGLLASEDPQLAVNKRLAFDLWRGIVNGGHVELADELLTEDYIQHSPVLPTGRAAFKQIFSAVPRRDEIPALPEPPLVALVAEGPLVAMVLLETLPDPAGNGTYTTAHFNLFRVENGRIAEHWHSVHTPPGPDVATPAAGGPQPITGATGTDQYALLASTDPELAANKRLVFNAWRQIADAGRQELAAVYLAEDFVDRNPNTGPGRNGFLARITARGARPIATATDDPLVAMLAEGDRVVQVRMQEHPHPARAGATYTTAWFDMFRIEDGLIAEHWDSGTRPTAASCEPDRGLGYLCGLSNAEDIVPIGDSPWLLVSSMNERNAPGPGRIWLVDSATRTAEEFFPGTAPVLRHDRSMFGDCEGIDLQAFDTHGLALRATAPDRFRLYATSHGAQEAIQAFELDMSGERPAIAWVGCVPLPSEVWANSVAILDDGGFVVTQFMDQNDPGGIAKILAGEVSGSVYEWHPGGSVTPIPGTGLSGANGIELSPDQRYLYVAAFGGQRVVRFDRRAPTAAPAAVDLGIAADNLRWTARGTLLTAGRNGEPNTGWSIFEIDPAAMTAARIGGMDRSAALQNASTALEVGNEIWVGAPFGNRLGYLLAP